uniref:Uncharacterized protein n=1 Tax=Chromera velia CCMP2878 TaxID=1169474 RepID=A0A0G4HNR4_9ALVE|eukprot:Cvel_7687.t1-p1 / transcript=Cvel_7687.t1 / gene=Cvel_7687 / organism=Chromera_velia_CCMP2878 / gene_product=Putative ankyrin repeat protein RF_0381, putative / transcript_product=Putative ankyrin repeat protein RF_0381, putative / location=Cvel_scaffold408:22817-24361(-) / protein_length=515 / sequence_SO=supercontig / SO=protein_coding / is_pseudo=false
MDAPSLAESVLPLLKGIEDFEQTLLRLVESVRGKRKVLQRVAANCRQSSQGRRSVAAFPAPLPDTEKSAARPNASQEPPGKALMALDGLLEFGPVVRGKVHSYLDQIMSQYYKMDLSALFAGPVRNVIRSFRPISKQSVSEALERFQEEGGRENFGLFLHVGAQLDPPTVGLPPLFSAVVEGKLEAARMLLQAGAEVDAVCEGLPGIEETPLLIAISKGNLPAVQLLVEGGADLEKRSYMKTPLLFAIDKERLEIAQYLVSAGADMSAEDDNGQKPLDYAAYLGLTDLLEFMLMKGADLNAKTSGGWVKGFSAVHHAAVGGNMETVLALLRRGVDVNCRDDKGRTPIFCTVMQGRGTARDNVEVAECFLSWGADLNARNSDGCTILHFSVAHGAEKVAELVLDRGVDVNATDNEGNTALHSLCIEEPSYSTQPKSVDIARLLLDRGIDFFAVNELGDTAAGVAEERLPSFSELRTFLSDTVAQGEGEGSNWGEEEFLSVGAQSEDEEMEMEETDV